MKLSILLALACLSACATATGGGAYLLPFAPGDAHGVLQGFNGRHGHTQTAAYAYDFVSAIGTTVTAARAGTVIAVVESNADAQPRHPEPGHENYVVVDHGDDTYGRYYHLTTNGADVAVGDRVRKGQAIGRSGNSGASFGPHLHFDVTRGCYNWGCQTIAFSFAGVADDLLREGASYSR